MSNFMTTNQRLNPLRRDIKIGNTCLKWWKTYMSYFKRRMWIVLREIEAPLIPGVPFKK
jgi:hypothetical protein